MPGKDRVEYDILANDKASTPMDKIARSSKKLGNTLESAAKEGSQGLQKLQEEAKKTDTGLAKMGDGAKAGMAKLGEGLKAGPLAFIGLGAGLGAAVIQGFSDAMEKQDANALLGAQLGASDAQMGKLGKISGDMYKNAFGESVSEVNGVLKTVFQSGLATINDAEDDIKGVTEQVMNYSKLTGEEALPVTRAISQMLKTGLAKNATEAFDLLTRGTQKGLDTSEDLLDTVNEYGTQFRKVGLNGQQAFGLISQAMQNGARDSDIAADAIKEFSIRAQDGSASAAASYKALGLNAKQMSADVAGGGPKAAAALGLVLDKLRAAKDRSDFATIAFGLFGTQSEDLGDALKNMNLGTAAKDFGLVAGAAQRAGDVINDTASNKIATVKRTIQTSIVDAIGKYALPKLEQFADWFNGPGKMVILSWAISGAQQFLLFADGALNALGKVIPGLVKFGVVALRAGAAATAIVNPKLSHELNQQANALEDWGTAATQNLDDARGSLKEWGATLETTKTKVELQADIEGLEQKLAKAQKELRDPGLTKERRATLNANIAQLLRQKDAALRQLGDPNLIKVRTAQLQANKADLDAKLAAARRALADPKLTATKRAKLEATIAQLLRQKAQAQAAINSLTGKTVNIVMNTYKNLIETRIPGGTGVKVRAKGGPVRKGEAYIVGEKRPELFMPTENGVIVPRVPSSASPTAVGYSGGGGGGGGMVTLSFDDSETGRFIMSMVRKGIANSGSGGNVQLALAGRPV